MRWLHVSDPMWRYLKDQCPGDREVTAVGGSLGSLSGMPVDVDKRLTGGQWEVWDEGQVIAYGDVAPVDPGWSAVYWPVTGKWYALNSSVCEDVRP